MPPRGYGRSVARKFSIRGLCVSSGGLDTLKIDKTTLIYRVPCFNFGGLSPPKPPSGDGTVSSHCCRNSEGPFNTKILNRAEVNKIFKQLGTMSIVCDPRKRETQ